MHRFSNLAAQMVVKGIPDPSDVYVQPELTEVLVDWMQDQTAFVHPFVFPSIPIEQQSGQWPEYPRGYVWRDDMEPRADGAPTPEGGWAVKYTAMSATVWGWKTKVGPQLRANAKRHNLDQVAMKLCGAKALINREVQFMSNFFTTGKWTTQKQLTAAGDPVDDLSWLDVDADPVAQLEARFEAMTDLVGELYKPNIGIFGRKAWRLFKTHPNVRGYIGGGSTQTQPSLVSLQKAAELLGLERVLIAGAIKTSNAEQAAALKGANDTFARIGTTNACMFVHTPSAATYGEPMAGATWEWGGYTGAGANGTRMSRWFDPETKSDKFEVESAYGMSVVSPDMGIFVYDVDAA